MKICPSDKATERQVAYAAFLQSYLNGKYTEDELSALSKQQIGNYITEIESQASEIREELQSHLYDIW